jgi:hypothetical protein
MEKKLDSIDQKLNEIILLFQQLNLSDSMQTPVSKKDFKAEIDSIALIYKESVKKNDSLVMQREAVQNELNDLNNSQKECIEKEINLIIISGTGLDYNLLRSMQTRAKQFKASNLTTLIDFMNFFLCIDNAKKILEHPYNKDTTNTHITVLLDLNINQNLYPALFEEKRVVLTSLKRYCEKYYEIAKTIEDSKVLNNDRRYEELSIEYKVEDYPFLLDALKKARNDKNFSLELIPCED